MEDQTSAVRPRLGEPVDLGRRMADSRIASVLFAAAALVSALVTSLVTAVVLVLVGAPFVILLALMLDWPAGHVLHSAVMTVAGVGVAGTVCFLPFLVAIAEDCSGIVSRRAGVAPPTELQLQRLTNVVSELAVAAGLDPPGVAVLGRGRANAMAVGPVRDPTIAVTPDLLELLDRAQLQAVLAHEMAHIRNGDIRFMTFLGGIFVRFNGVVTWATTQSAAVFGTSYKPDAKSPGVPQAIATPGVLLGRLFARLTGLAASRRREYLADDTAVRLTRDPQALIDALLAIAKANGSYGDEAPGIAHLCIVDPGDPPSTESRLLATHPPLAKRIERLRWLLGQQGVEP